MSVASCMTAACPRSTTRPRILSHSATPTWLVVIASVVAATPSAAQDSVLKVFYVETVKAQTSDVQRLSDAFTTLVAFVRSQHKDFPYRSALAKPTNSLRGCEPLKEHSIVQLSPARFILCSRELGTRLQPLLVTRKVGDASPYYSANFVINSRSKITLFPLAGIKRLVLVDRNSASGYVEPLTQLYHMNAISSPTESAVRSELGWDVTLAEQHEGVLAQIAADSTGTSLGAVGAYGTLEPSLQGRVQSLLKYALIPQDVIVVNSELSAYASTIGDWFRRVVVQGDSLGAVDSSRSRLRTSSMRLDSVLTFEGEFATAYEGLKQRLQATEVKGVGSGVLGVLSRVGTIAWAFLVSFCLLGGIVLGHKVRTRNALFKATRALFAILLIVCWWMLMHRTSALRLNNESAVYIVLLVGVLLGVLLRVHLVEIGLIEQPSTRKGDDGWLFANVGASVILAFILALFYLIGSNVLYGKAPSLTLGEDYQRAAVALTMLSIGAGLLLEETAKEVIKRMLTKVQGQEP